MVGLLGAWRSLGGFVFQKERPLRDARLSRKKTQGVPINRGKARRYTETVLSARGGVKGRGSKGEKQVPRRARDDNGEGGAY